VLGHITKLLAILDHPVGWWPIRLCDQSVAEPLMILIAVGVSERLANRVLHRVVSKEEHLVETLLFDLPRESLNSAFRLGVVRNAVENLMSRSSNGRRESLRNPSISSIRILPP